MSVLEKEKIKIQRAPSRLTLPLVSSEIRSKKKGTHASQSYEKKKAKRRYVMYGTVPDSVERENFGGNWVVVKGIFSAVSHQSGRSLGARELGQ